jgi:hypothetical protein
LDQGKGSQLPNRDVCGLDYRRRVPSMTRGRRHNKGLLGQHVRPDEHNPFAGVVRLELTVQPMPPARPAPTGPAGQPVVV